MAYEQKEFLPSACTRTQIVSRGFMKRLSKMVVLFAFCAIVSLPLSARAATTIGLNISTGGTMTVGGATTLQGAVSVSSGNLVDLSGIQQTVGGNVGLQLPVQTSNTQAPGSGSGFIAYSTTSGTLMFYDGAAWQSVMTTIGSQGNLLPSTNNTYNIGSGAYSWKHIFASGTGTFGGMLLAPVIDRPTAGQLQIGVTTSTSILVGKISVPLTLNASSITTDASILSDTNNTNDLGSGSFSWRHIFASSTGIFGGMLLAPVIDRPTAGQLQIGLTTSTSILVGKNTTPLTLNASAITTDASILLDTNNSHDLGSQVSAWRNVYASTTGYFGTSVRTNSVDSINHSTLNVGTSALNTGTVSIGNSASPTLLTGLYVTLSQIANDVLPASPAAYSLGSVSYPWINFFASGTGVFNKQLLSPIFDRDTAGQLQIGVTTSTSILVGKSTTPLTLNASAITTDASILLDTNNSHDLGSQTSAWRDIFTSGTLYAGTAVKSKYIDTPVDTDTLRIGTLNAHGANIIGTTTAPLTLIGSAIDTFGSFIPFTTNWDDLGSFAKSFRNVYASGTVYANNVSPAAANMNDIGSYTLPWRDVYVSGTIYGASMNVNNQPVALASFADNGNALRAKMMPGLTQYLNGFGSSAVTLAGAKDMAFDGKNLWVHASSGNLYRFDPVSNQITATIVLTSQGQVTFDGTYIWVADSLAGTVRKIDVASASSVGTVTLGGGQTPLYLTYAGQYIWEAGSGNILNKINPTTLAVTPLTLDTAPGDVAYPSGLTFDGQYLWVPAIDTHFLPPDTWSIKKVDVATAAIASTVSLAAAPGQIGFDGQNIWLITGNTVKKINPVTNAVIATITVGTGPTNVTFTGDTVWVVNNTSQSISVINPGTNAVIAASAIGADVQTAVSVGEDVWVSEGSSNKIVRFSRTPLGMFGGLRVDQMTSGTAEFVNSVASTTPFLQLSGSATNYAASSPNAILRIDTATAPGTGFDFISTNASAVGIINPVFRVRGDGQIFSDAGVTITTPADVAELTKVSGDFSQYLDGTIVTQSSEDEVAMVADATHNHFLGVATDRGVFMGSGRWGKEIGDFGGKIGDFEKSQNVRRISVTGYIKIRVNDENGAINPGDLLGISSVPGEARKALAGDTIIGMARASFPPTFASTPPGAGSASAVVKSTDARTAANHGLVESVIGNGVGLSSSNMLQYQGLADSNGSILAGGANLLSGSASSSPLIVHDTATFAGDLLVQGHPYFNQDVAGLAKMLISATTVHVKFNMPYASTPVVTITPEQKIIGTSWVETVSREGFDIRIDAPQGSPVIFDWHALAVIDKQLFVSDGTHGAADQEYLWGTGATQTFIMPAPQTSTVPSILAPVTTDSSSSSPTIPSPVVNAPVPETPPITPETPAIMPVPAPAAPVNTSATDGQMTGSNDASGGPAPQNPLPYLEYTRG